MADSLEDTTVAIFLAQRGTEQVEFTDPKEAVESAGASVDVLGTETGEAQAVNSDLDPGRFLRDREVLCGRIGRRLRRPDHPRWSRRGRRPPG